MVSQGYGKPHILVVDDNRDIVDSTVAILEASGYQASSAYDAETALRIAQAKPPNAVLLDLAMPRHDGLRLARELRQISSMEKALLICISGHGTAADKERSAEAGFDHHFIKPVEWSELLWLLGQVMTKN